MESTDDNLDGQYRHQQDAGVADLSRASWTGRREAETGLKQELGGTPNPRWDGGGMQVGVEVGRHEHLRGEEVGTASNKQPALL